MNQTSMQGLKRTGILFFILLWGAHCSAQTVEVWGTVTTFHKIPVQNAEVRAKKSGEIVYTDSSGLFHLNCMPRDVLRIRAAGFDNCRVRTRGGKFLTVDIVYSNKEKSRTEALKGRHITAKDLDYALVHYPLKGQRDYSHYSDIFQLIAAEVPQVDVNGSSITSPIQTTFLMGQDVLTVVDGIVIYDISTILPADVRSVKYVKGTEASKYGMQSVNGVLEITLKTITRASPEGE